MTAVSGSSDYFLGGVISYANRLKQDELAVPADLLAAHGAVSEPVAAAMAAGARRRYAATYALAITGIAGPAGGSPDKPVGLVYTALAGPQGTRVQRNQLPGDSSHGSPARGADGDEHAEGGTEVDFRFAIFDLNGAGGGSVEFEGGINCPRFDGPRVCQCLARAVKSKIANRKSKMPRVRPPSYRS